VSGCWPPGALALGLAACDGSNAFSPVGVGPSVVDLFAPEQAPGASQFQVSARAVAAVRVDSIVVTVTGGGIDYRQTQTNAGRENDVTYTFDVSVPAAISDTIATISAIAFDAQGNQSLTRTRTIRLVDSAPPEVQISVSSDSVSQGGMVSMTVTATDNIGLVRTGVEVRTPSGEILFADSISVTAAPRPTFQWQLADDLDLGVYTARAFAVDLSGNRASSEAATIQVTPLPDVEGPSVTIEGPVGGSLFYVGDEIPVQFTVADELGPVRTGVNRITVQLQATPGLDTLRTGRHLWGSPPPAATPLPPDSLPERPHVLRILSFRTAGESHGKGLTALLEGIPAGLSLVMERDVDPELARRQQGYGRGRRMQIEIGPGRPPLRACAWARRWGRPSP
jgi:hypothetical protein